MKRSVFLPVIFTVLSYGAAAFGDPPSLVGRHAPDWTLKQENGESLSLKSLASKTVLLHFWATWCPSCKKETASLISLASEMKDKSFVIVMVNSGFESTDPKPGISADSPPGVRWLHDPDAKVAALYRVVDLPVTFLIDPTGTILKQFRGPQDWRPAANRALITPGVSDPSPPEP